MKKQTIICILIAYAITYMASSNEADLSNISDLFDFALSGAVFTFILNQWWNFIKGYDNDTKE